MQWSDVTAAPASRTLRQFSALWLLIFAALAGSRLSHGQQDLLTMIIAVAAVGVGVAGLIRPSSIRLIFTAAMIVSFPIGWVVSKLLLAVLFYVIFTPIGLAFRMTGRDALRLKRRKDASFWTPYPGERKPEDYFRQF